MCFPSPHYQGPAYEGALDRLIFPQAPEKAKVEVRTLRAQPPDTHQIGGVGGSGPGEIAVGGFRGGAGDGFDGRINRRDTGRQALKIIDLHQPEVGDACLQALRHAIVSGNGRRD